MDRNKIFGLEIPESDVEKREVIDRMAMELQGDQLIQVIETMMVPYLTVQMRDYMVDEQLPKMDSQEFQFLVKAQENNGVLSKKETKEAGITPYSFNKFIKKYRLKEIVRGIYIFSNKPIDGLYLFQKQYSKAVVSHETALYYLGLNDVLPKEKITSLPRNYKMTQLYTTKESTTNYRTVYPASEWNSEKKGVFIIYRENDPIRVVGNRPIPETQIRKIDSGYGNLIRVTSMERAIADILSTRWEVEDEIKEVALRRYFEQESLNRNRLRRIANQQKVLKELDEWLLKLKL